MTKNLAGQTILLVLDVKYAEFSICYSAYRCTLGLTRGVLLLLIIRRLFSWIIIIFVANFYSRCHCQR
jgi:hypothetical protein